MPVGTSPTVQSAESLFGVSVLSPAEKLRPVLLTETYRPSEARAEAEGKIVRLSGRKEVTEFVEELFSVSPQTETYRPSEARQHGT